jgi:hypothetical protein
VIPRKGWPTTRFVETPASPPKKAGEHQHGREHHLADAERDQRERCPGAARGDVAEEDSERHPGQPANQRQQRDRERKRAFADQVQRVHR